MKIYISILRGINVSGQKKIKMKDLRKLYEDLNFKNIKTYIQSGNVIFEDQTTIHRELEERIEKKILQNFGFSIPVVVKDKDELIDVIKNNPFLNLKKEDTSKLHITFLSDEPEPSRVDKIKGGQYEPDEFTLSGKVIYLFCPNGYGRTKLSNNFFENKLKVVATTRNWKTLNELINIATGSI